MHTQSEEKNSESMNIPNSADFVGEGILLSNDTWKHVMDASKDYYAFISRDFKVLRINKAMAGLLGGEPQNFVGKNCFEVFNDKQAPCVDCPILKINGSQSVQASEIESEIFGRTFHKAIPQYTTDGSLTGCLHIVESLNNKPPQVTSVKDNEAGSPMESLVNAIPDPAVLCDMTGLVLVASQEFVNITGLKDPAALKGTNFISFFTHENIDKALIGFNGISFGTLERFSGRFLIRRAGNDPLHVEVSMNPFRKAGGSASGILLTFHDVSGQVDLKEMAEKNQIRLSRFNRTFMGFSSEPALNINRLVVFLGEMLGASSCIYSKYEEGTPAPFVTWNSPYLLDFSPERINSIVHEQFLRQPGDQILLLKPQLAGYFAVNPELQDRYGIKSILGLLVRTGDKILGQVSLAFTYHYQFRSEDKEFCSMVISALALESSRMAVSHETVVSDMNYREQFDFITDAIFILDADGKIIDENSGATRMFGFTKEEMTGRTLDRLSGPGNKDPEIMMKAIGSAFQGESRELEWWGIKSGGDSFPVDFVLNRGRFFGRDVVIAIGRDITERKQAEDKLLEYNLELKETNQSKDKFFSILAHDLKNPFGGLLGFIDLLYEDIDELSTDQVKEYLQNIRTASYHTYSLLENLLEWSRIQTGKVQFRPSRFDLSEEINSVLTVLESNAIRKNIRLINEVPSGIEAEADRNMIRSIIQNLTTNAIKFSNSNSNVTIHGKYTIAPGKTNDSEGISKPRRWFEVSVTDLGIGIPEEIMPKLFRLDGQFSMSGTANEPGTGLGLILCKEMVEKNGGRIRVESNADKGSTFSFTLPLSE